MEKNLHNFEPSLVKEVVGGVRDEMVLDVNELRIQIAAVDQKIAFYVADIKKSDMEMDKVVAETEAKVAQFQKVQRDIMKMQSKQPGLEAYVTKYEEKTKETGEKLAAVKSAVEDTHEFRMANKKRVEELQQAIGARKKMMEDAGYDAVARQRLEEELMVARARLAELKVKDAAKNKKMKPNHTEWANPKQASRR